jgi:hypothetical protein
MLTPNPDALTAFHQAYQDLVSAGPSPGWSRDACLRLGHLFRRVYGIWPPWSWCTPGCHLPAMATLQQLFGSYAGYLDALEEETR